jgi:putative two-component system response regulator
MLLIYRGGDGGGLTMDKKKRILVADDELGVIESFRIMFKDSYEILTANTGQECLNMVKQDSPQLLILDVRLPDMNGMDVFKKIREDNIYLPIIVITGVGTHKTAIEALKLGAVDFVAKPINFYYVRNTIRNVFLTNYMEKPGLPTAGDVIAKSYISTLKTLNRILEARDQYTRIHSQKVSEYALKIAQELGFSQDEQEVMYQTALLHDIGKVGVAEMILNKPDKLSPQEWSEIKKHAQIGEEFLAPLKALHIEQSMIRHHHERYDGRGYPDRLKGEDIPLYARILAVADAYEAMTSQRPYRKPISQSEAIAELKRCSGTQFDPEIVKAFVKTLEEENNLERD